MQHAHDLGDENAQPWLLFLLGDVERISEISKPRSNVPAPGRGGRAVGTASLRRAQPRARGLVQAQQVRPSEARDAASRLLGAPGDTSERIISAEALGHLGLVLGTPEEAVAPSSRRSRPFVQGGHRRARREPLRRRSDRGSGRARAAGGRRPRDPRLVRGQCSPARARLCARQLPTLPRPPCGSGRRARAALADFEEALLVARPCRDPARSRSDAARARSCSASRETTTRGARDAGECPRRLRRDRCRALGGRARGELRRISGRAPTTGALTPAEERVAALVAEGKTNREVAASPSSDRTVEGHLSRIFGKLGVRHRTELSSPRLPSITGDREVKHGGLDRFGRAGRSVASRQVVRRAAGGQGEGAMTPRSRSSPPSSARRWCSPSPRSATRGVQTGIRRPSMSRRISSIASTPRAAGAVEHARRPRAFLRRRRVRRRSSRRIPSAMIASGSIHRASRLPRPRSARLVTSNGCKSGSDSAAASARVRPLPGNADDTGPPARALIRSRLALGGRSRPPEGGLDAPGFPRSASARSDASARVTRR